MEFEKPSVQQMNRMSNDVVDTLFALLMGKVKCVNWLVFDLNTTEVIHYKVSLGPKDKGALTLLIEDEEKVAALTYAKVSTEHEVSLFSGADLLNGTRVALNFLLSEALYLMYKLPY